MYPPCKNPENTIKTENSQVCNTQKCKECFSGRGKNYAGVIKKAYSGEKCRSACRSDAFFSHPMCFISKTEWKYCDVPSCKLTEIRPIPLITYKHLPVHNLPILKCKFPFYFEGVKYKSCSKIETVDKTNKLCGTSQDSSETKFSLAICPESSIGSLSDWEDTLECTKKCDNGKNIFRRNCLNPPCDDKIFTEKHVGSCNDFPCTACVLEGTNAQK